MSEKITKAKSSLILDQPFFASLLLGMSVTEDNQVETMGVNGKGIRYNKAWVESLTHPELTFVLAHEVMHCVFEHMYTRGTRDFMRWNIAGDYIINDMLVKEKVGIMPQQGLYDPKLVAKAGYTTAGVYDLLPESKSMSKIGKPGGPLDQCDDAPGDEAEHSKNAAEMRVKVLQAANAAKMCGALSQNLKRLINDIAATRTDWRAILRHFLTERTKTDWSFAKPKRRFMADDLMLPSLVGEQLGEIVVAVDCSGSIDETLLNKFGAEINTICQDTRPRLVRVIYFDSEVCGEQTFEQGETVTLAPHGGGGTAFSPIWDHIVSKDYQPVACVVLTDLECSDFGDAPEYPVLWASTSQDNAPFGEIIKLKE